MKKIALLTAVVAAAIMLASGPAFSGEIIGKIKYGGKAEKEKIVVDENGGLANAVVYLDKVKGKFAPPKEPVIVDQVDKMFTPHVAAALKGSTLVVKNSDPIFHNVSSDSKVSKFNVGQADKGDKTEIVLNKTGVVDMYCDVHNWMSAYVVVLDNPYFTVTNEKGLFKIDGMDPGEYEVKVWHEKLGELETSVTVPKDDKAKMILEYK